MTFVTNEGVVCLILPDEPVSRCCFVMESNVQAMRSSAEDSPFLARYSEVALVLSGNPEATPADGVDWVQNLCRQMEVPGLSEFSVNKMDFSTIVSKTHKSNSVKGNPIKLTDDELVSILDQNI